MLICVFLEQQLGKGVGSYSIHLTNDLLKCQLLVYSHTMTLDYNLPVQIADPEL